MRQHEHPRLRSAALAVVGVSLHAVSAAAQQALPAPDAASVDETRPATQPAAAPDALPPHPEITRSQPMPYIDPPEHIPWLLRPGIWFAEREAGAELLPARLLAWYPKAAISSGTIEALIAHDEPGVPRRLLKLIRMQVSFDIGSPFCVEMNSLGHEQDSITPEEYQALQGLRPLDEVPTLTPRERAALQYTRDLTRYPLVVEPAHLAALKAHFDERQIVIVATTIAQVNYWTRLNKGLGVPAIGRNKTKAAEGGG